MNGFSNNTNLKESHLVLGGFVLLLAVFLCYAEILYKLAKHWVVDPNYSHGFLIPVLSGYLLWKKKETLILTPISPSTWGIPLLMFGLVLLILGKAGNIAFATRFSFLVVLIGSFWLLLGTDTMKAVFFPICYLIFMIPLPGIVYNDLTFRLRLFATILSTKVISLTGIPVFREGNIMLLSETSLQVIDACSGMRSLMSLLALGLLVAYLTQSTLWKRLCLTLLTIPIAIFSNVWRLSVTGILSHFYGARVAEGFFHTYSGMVFFSVAFVLLFFCTVILKKIRSSESSPNSFKSDFLGQKAQGRGL